MTNKYNSKKGSDVNVAAFMKKLEFSENIKEFKEEEPLRNEAYRMIAHELKSYYEALVQEGFNDVQALSLVGTYAMTWLHSQPQDDGDKNN